MAQDLIALAERCEAATGADRELDGVIDRLFNERPKDGDYDTAENCLWRVGEDSGLCTRSDGFARKSFCAKPYTASLDVAMTLVPEGWRWIMREACPDKANPNERGFFARLETSDFESVTWGKGSDWLTDVVAGQAVSCWAAPPALALCAAALRARATPNQDTDNG